MGKNDYSPKVWAVASSEGGGWNGEDMYSSHVLVRPSVPQHEMIRCKYCEAKNKWNAPHCTSCGAPLPEENEERNQEGGRAQYTEYEEPESLIAKIMAKLSGK